ncbi:MAG: carboxypeptidase-like regulatory domain-containing protein, partial [Candidatus Marinimicrobia bacterium]|nr:carboxypeptidase-like regulatory domain-containing protein [Candidatus Neomarinimicrobiota bacterium]
MVAKLGKCLVVLVVGLFFVGEASAQATVSGRVTDAATGDPLAGANVMVEGTALGDAADASGSYSISNVPSGAQTVTASMIGYASGSSSVNVPS